MRLLSIDILRGLAVTLVLFRHFGIVEVLGKIGWSGVDLFFVISGFLVSGLLFREFQSTGEIKPMRFLIRRGFKIYPPFYFFLAFTVAKTLLVFLSGYAGNKNFNLKALLAEIFFVQNYFGRLWSHTWSLAVEEHFYFLLILLVTFVVAVRQIDDSRLFANIFFVVACICLLLRWHNFLSTPFKVDTHLIYTHLRIDSLFFGVFLSHMYNFNRSMVDSYVRKNMSAMLITAVLCLSCMFFADLTSMFMSTVGLSLTYLGFGIILITFIQLEGQLHAASRGWMHFLIKPLALVGAYSYSIYLWHLAVLVYLVEPFLIPLNEKLAFSVYFAGSIFVGVVTSKMFEKPFLKLREKMFPMFKKYDVN